MVVNQLLPLGSVGGRIAAFAEACVHSIAAPAAAAEGRGGEAGTVGATEEEAEWASGFVRDKMRVGPPQTPEEALRRIALPIAMCTRRPGLLRAIAETFARAPPLLHPAFFSYLVRTPLAKGRSPLPVPQQTAASCVTQYSNCGGADGAVFIVALAAWDGEIAQGEGARHWPRRGPSARERAARSAGTHPQPCVHARRTMSAILRSTDDVAAAALSLTTPAHSLTAFPVLCRSSCGSWRTLRARLRIRGPRSSSPPPERLARAAEGTSGTCCRAWPRCQGVDGAPLIVAHAPRRLGPPSLHLSPGAGDALSPDDI